MSEPKGRQQISLSLMTKIGITKATSIMSAMQNDPLLHPPQDGHIVIRP